MKCVKNQGVARKEGTTKKIRKTKIVQSSGRAGMLDRNSKWKDSNGIRYAYNRSKKSKAIARMQVHTKSGYHSFVARRQRQSPQNTFRALIHTHSEFSMNVYVHTHPHSHIYEH